MPKIVVTAQIEDPVKWEAGFRTHGELFRNAYTVTNPIGIAITEGNEIAVCFEPEDLDKALAAIDSPVLAPLSVGSVWLRRYGAVSYSQNSACDLCWVPNVS